MINEFRGKYRWLSNFWLDQVVYEGLVYPSTENAFQAAKSTDRSTRREFLSISPSEAKKLGMTIMLREDWDDIKLDVMKQLNHNKFTRGSYLANKLLDTGHQVLMEGNTWKDVYWGVDLYTGIGANNLGKILMRIRTNLRDK